MRTLLTGKTGQVGWELERQFADLGDLVATDRSELDLSQEDQIRKTVRRVRPQLIVNAAAYTAVDQAEKEPDLAMAVNGTAPGILAEEAGKIGAALIHYSTDYVFDGEKSSGPYVEDDLPNPKGIYGQSKLAGEQAIVSQGIPYLILRTSWVYGARGRNFFMTILRLAKEKEELRVVNDQIGSPTWCRSIAEATRQILLRFLDSSTEKNLDSLAEVSGLYHLSCEGQTSWYDFTEAILKHSGLTQRPRVIPIPTSEYPTPAARPKYSVLSNAKIKRVFKTEMPNWQDALKQCMGSDTSG